MIIFLIYLFRTLFVLMEHIFWWDRKEFRFDRMYVHLSETEQGKHWMFNAISNIKWVLFVVYFWIPIELKSFYSYTVIVLYTVELYKYIQRRKILMPKPFLRPKPVFISIVSLTILLTTVAMVSFEEYAGFALLIGDKLLAFLVLFSVMLTWPPFSFLVWYKTRKAAARIKRTKRLKIIGITGSYGKSTTKEYIYQLLSQKYRVLKTKAGQNTQIGIAETILSHNLANYDYFVCGTAAYHPGEIKKITSLFANKLNIVVITGINQQHQSLFGSMENTLLAKYELVEAAKKKVPIVINSDDLNTKPLINRSIKEGRTVIAVKTRKTKSNNSLEDIFAINRKIAQTVARIAGVTIQTSTAKIHTLARIKQTMTVHAYGTVTIIDDSFNANPDGVYAALKHLSVQKDSIRLVLQPLIELGSYAQTIHEKIGEMAGSICTDIILTNTNFKEALLRGLKKSKIDSGQIYIGRYPPGEFHGTVLFEGKESEQYIQKAIQK